MTALLRNNVQVTGKGTRPLVFAHGYGCDQAVWHKIVPAFTNSYKIVTYDLTGSGHSELWAYDRNKYATLQGHATDLIEICQTLGLDRPVIIGHSVSAMSAVLAANAKPDFFTALAMIAPSPCYVNHPPYEGGFEQSDIEGLLDFLDSNFMGWSTKMAPIIMGVQDDPDLAAGLTTSFCRSDSEIAKHFGRVTFTSDHREDVKDLTLPALIMQCRKDIVAPLAVGNWLKANMPSSDLVVMNAQGHCPHLSAPAETIAALKTFLSDIDYQGQPLSS